MIFYNTVISSLGAKSEKTNYNHVQSHPVLTSADEFRNSHPSHLVVDLDQISNLSSCEMLFRSVKSCLVCSYLVRECARVMHRSDK